MDGHFDRRLFDRRLYLAIAVLFSLVIFIGFGPSYYLKTFFGTPPLPSALVHIHGLVMTAWVALFLVQVRLISTKRVRLHQRLGYAGIGLAVLIIVTGLPTAIAATKYGSLATPRDIPPLSFLAIPFFDLVMFAILFGAAVVYRRRPATHKRLMLMTAINFLPPALARIPIPSMQPYGPLWFFGVPTALAILVLILDARKHGVVNRALAWGIAALFASYVLRLAIMGTGPWLAFARWMVNLN
jgi:hypothetical protein